MPGKKIPVLEVGDLYISNDGRGLLFYNDGTNCLVTTSGINKLKSGSVADGYLKFAYISGTSSTETDIYVKFYTSL